MEAGGPAHTVAAMKTLVAGGGVAAIETVLALQALAGDRVEIELLAPGGDFIQRAPSVRTPFDDAAEAPRVALAELGVTRHRGTLAAVEGNVAGLRAGQFVTVLATTDEEKTGFAIPRAALVRNANGQDVVYEHVAAERFEPRPVRVEPLDGDRVFVATGLAAGKRLVVQGAELLGQVR